MGHRAPGTACARDERRAAGRQPRDAGRGVRAHGRAAASPHRRRHRPHGPAGGRRRRAARRGHRPVAPRRAARHRLRRLRGHHRRAHDVHGAAPHPRSSGHACRRSRRRRPRSARRRSRTAPRSGATSATPHRPATRCPSSSPWMPRSTWGRRPASGPSRLGTSGPPTGRRRCAPTSCCCGSASRSSGTATRASARSARAAAQAISKVVMALSYQEDGGVWRERAPRPRVGGRDDDPCPRRPRRSSKVRRLGRAVADHAAAVLADELQPIDDVRSTADYRRSVSARVLHRLLREEGGW